MSSPTRVPSLKAIDIEQAADVPIESNGIAYYRLTPEMREFLQLCEDKDGILGFEWDGSFNFGVILKKPPVS